MISFSGLSGSDLNMFAAANPEVFITSLLCHILDSGTNFLLHGLPRTYFLVHVSRLCLSKNKHTVCISMNWHDQKLIQEIYIVYILYSNIVSH